MQGLILDLQGLALDLKTFVFIHKVLLNTDCISVYKCVVLLHREIHCASQYRINTLEY